MFDNELYANVVNTLQGSAAIDMSDYYNVAYDATIALKTAIENTYNVSFNFDSADFIGAFIEIRFNCTADGQPSYIDTDGMWLHLEEIFNDGYIETEVRYMIDFMRQFDFYTPK